MKYPRSSVKTSLDSPLGRLLLATAHEQLVGVWFEGQKHAPDSSDWPAAPACPVLVEACTQLTDYFAGRRMAFELPLDLSSGSAFQQMVWSALLRIPRGATLSYGALSTQIGKTSAVRAVGAAIGRNPLSIIVPCHRVIGAQGALTGYAGGLARKTALLQLEGAL